MRRRPTVACLLALTASSSGELAAQGANPSAASFGLMGAYTARARGYEALAWNAANLGLPDRPKWSVGLPAVNVFIANNSFSYGQLSSLYGEFLDTATKLELLDDIRRSDQDRMFRLEADASAHFLGFSLGRFAIGGGTLAAGSADLTADAAEFVLFGNVSEDGTRQDLDLSGSGAQGWWISSVGMSYGQPIEISALARRGFEFSVGGTVRYLQSHAFGRLVDSGTRFTAEPLTLGADGEALYSDNGATGRGWSIDLGVALQWESLTAGIAVQNLAGNISWDHDHFSLGRYIASADFGSSTARDETVAFADLDSATQARVTDLLDGTELPKRLRLGGVYVLSPKLTLSADFEELIGGRLRLGWERKLAVGGELNVIKFLPLRAGLATSFDEFAYGGGFGVYLSVVRFDFGIRSQGLSGGDGIAAAASFGIWPKGSR